MEFKRLRYPQSVDALSGELKGCIGHMMHLMREHPLWCYLVAIDSVEFPGQKPGTDILVMGLRLKIIIITITLTCKFALHFFYHIFSG